MVELLGDLRRDRTVARRTAIFAAVLGVAAVAVLLPRVLAPSPEVCAGAEQKLAGIWDPTVRAAVQARFAETDKAYAGETFTRVAARLDGYATGWAAMHREACVATARGEQSPAALDLRMACLGRRLTEVGALTALFATADADVVLRSVSAAGALADLAGCADVARLAAPLPPPGDPRTQADVDEVRAVLATADAQLKTGRFREAMGVAGPAFAAARGLPYLPLRAEADLVVGRLLLELEDPKGAEPILRQAVLAADAGHHDEVRADAQTSLVTTLRSLERYDDALRAAEAADAAVTRLGDSPLRSARVDNEVGLVLQTQGKLDEAEVRFAASLALRERALGKDSLEVADSLDGLGNNAVLQGKFEAAAVLHERALAIAEKTLGPSHPRVAKLLVSLARSLRNLEKFDRAQELLERARHIQEAARGPDSLELALILGVLGAVLHDRGDSAGARAYMARGLAIYERVDPGSLAGAKLLVNLGRLDDERGSYDQALDALERALAIFERRLGPDHATIGDVLSSIGAVHRNRREYDRALTYLLRGEAILKNALGEDHPTVAWVESDLAETLSHLGRHREALERARRARAVFTAVHGADHYATLRAGELIAEALLEEGRTGEAIVEYEKAIAAMERTLGPTHQFLGNPLTNLGVAQMSLHRPAEALAALERALVLREQAGASIDPTDLAYTRFVLSRALWDFGHDRARSRALARTARQTYAAAGPSEQVHLVEIDAWLLHHR